MSDLESQARRFLERPLPPGNYGGDSLADDFIRRYLGGGPWDDPELRNLLRLCFFTAQTEAEGASGEAAEYDGECAEVLRGILLEIYGPKSIR